MKRSDMITKLCSIIDAGQDQTMETRADNLLCHLEVLGMKPPRVSEEDCQAIMSVYYGGYSFYQWDEDLEKDEYVQAAKTRRKLGKN